MPLTLFPESLEGKRDARLLRRNASLRGARAIDASLRGARAIDARAIDARARRARAIDAAAFEEVALRAV